MIKLVVRIENHYDGDVDTRTKEIEVEEPPFSYVTNDTPDSDDAEDALTEWADEEIFPHTGTGRTSGNSAYFVTVLTSTRCDLVPAGQEFEFGV